MTAPFYVAPVQPDPHLPSAPYVPGWHLLTRDNPRATCGRYSDLTQAQADCEARNAIARRKSERRP